MSTEHTPMKSISLLAGLLVFLVASVAFGQQTGTLYGTTEDVNGAPVSGIQITVSGSALIGGPRTQLTSADGQYQFVSIPVGTYQVTAEAKGFRKIVNKGVTVHLGESIETGFLMETQATEQVIEVSAKAPVVDKRKTSSGQTFDKQFLEDVPTGRSYQSVAQSAPGVTGGSNPVIHGGSSYSNNYYLDGINVTDPTSNTFGLNFNYEAMREVQVISGLFSPEYGNVTGGVINIITESGGNEFELDTGFYMSNDSMAMKDFEGNERDFATYEGYLNVGGPIVEDHLWYYLSTQYTYEETQLSDESPVPELVGIAHPQRLYQSFYWLGKLTWAPDAHNRFDLKIQGDPATIDNSDQDPSMAAIAETHQDQGGMLLGLNYDGLFDQVVVRFSGGYTTSFLDIFPQARVETSSPFGFPGVFGRGELSSKNSFGNAVGCVAPGDRADNKAGPGCSADIQANTEFGNGQHYDFDTGGVSGGSSSDVYIVRERIHLKPTLSYFLDDVGGDHELKTGLEVSFLKDTERVRYPGGVTYLATNVGDPDDDGYPNVTAFTVASNDNELRTENHGRNFAGFLLDNWNLFDRVYMQPGFRVENAQFDYDSLDKEFDGKTAFDFTVFSPRFGFSVDAFGDGQTRIHGGYARMYETGMLYLSKFVGKSLEVRRLSGDANDGRAGTPDEELPTDIRDYNYSEDPNRKVVQGGASGTAIDRDNLDPMQMDEWQLGIQQALSDNVSVDVSYIRRTTSDAWEDGENNVLWNQAGTDSIGTRRGDDQQTFLLYTIEAARRSYDTLEIALQRRFADRWMLNGSYNLTWYTGTTIELITGAYDNPRQAAHLNGPMPDEHRHQLKFQGSYRFDSGLTLGMDYLFETGGPYDRFFENAYDGDHTNRRAGRGYDPGGDPNDPSDDKPLRLADYTDIDLRAEFDTEQYTGQELALVVQIENLLNLQTVTSVEDKQTTTGNWGLPTNRQSPFQATVGLTYHY